MDDRIRIQKLTEAVELLLPLAETWRDELEARAQINPALAAARQNSKTKIDRVKMLLTEASE
jgi:hypothetical protein